MKLIRLLFLTICFLVIIGCWKPKQDLYFKDLLFWPQFEALGNFKLTYESMRNGVVTREYRAGGGDLLIVQVEQVRPILKDSALRRANEKWAKLDSIYDPSPSPYFAIITQEVSCPSQFRPVKTSTKDGFSIRHYANKNFVYRVCKESEVYYSVRSDFLSCDNNYIWVTTFAKEKQDLQYAIECR